ncbi:MAG: response regulator transcription factor [Bacteroidota bacterium]
MMTKPDILLVEDEPALAMVLQRTLEGQGFAVRHVLDGEGGLAQYQYQKPDLILLDVMLPKLSGFEVAKTIRQADRDTPILFLTAKAKGTDVVEGFEAGGNDYVRKPFSMEELMVRMRVLLSQKRLLPQESKEEESEFVLGSYRFFVHKLMLQQGKKKQQLTAREAELLRLFCQNFNQVVTKESILLALWGDDSYFNSRSLDVFISRLRKYLSGDDQVTLINLRGIGYKLALG